VLGSDISGVTDLLEHGRNGMTYRAGSVEDMVRAITEVVSEGRNMDQIRAQARETVVPDLTWSRCREQLQTLYQSLAP